MPVLISLLLTMLAATHFIAAYGFMIDILREAAGIEGGNTAMLHFSDHDESLGENNVYPHGAPYMFARREQTEVPIMLWISDGFSDRFGVDRRCLNNGRCLITAYFTRY